MRINKRKKIKAMGFIEVIIAIVVVGIASAVFLTMAGRAMRELVQVERGEYMKRVAKNGVNIAQEVANKQKAAESGEVFFPYKVSQHEGWCFVPVKSGDDYAFQMELDQFESISLMESDDSLREWAKAHPTNMEGAQDYFLVMCIKEIDPIYGKWANVYFWVGDIHVAGEITSDSDMKDIKYNAIINL